MVTYHVKNAIQTDVQMWLMDVAGVAYEVVPTDTKEPYLVVDGEQLTSYESLRWIYAMLNQAGFEDVIPEERTQEYGL